MLYMLITCILSLIMQHKLIKYILVLDFLSRISDKSGKSVLIVSLVPSFTAQIQYSLHWLNVYIGHCKKHSIVSIYSVSIRDFSKISNIVHHFKFWVFCSATKIAKIENFFARLGKANTQGFFFKKVSLSFWSAGWNFLLNPDENLYLELQIKQTKLR